MATIELKFIFDYYAESDQYETILHAGDYRDALHEMGEFLRTRYKHIDPHSEGHKEEFDEIWDKFFELVEGLELG